MGKFFMAVACAVAVVLVAGCAGGRKLLEIRKGNVTAEVAVGSLDDVEMEGEPDKLSAGVPQVIEVENLQGNKIIMNAVRDEQSGEMVAVEQLNEIVVQAKFRNVAERNGVVDLVFEIAVPEELQQKMWQVRFTPMFHILGDTLRADRILVTGEKFRKVQQWEYMMYNRYVGTLVPEYEAGRKYTHNRLKECFVARNGDVPGTELHYRKKLLDRINNRKHSAKGRIYDRLVVDPYPQSGVRLDSVILDGCGSVRYFYVQTIPTQKDLKRVDMVLAGEVYTNGRKLCDLSATEPITFYISSISAFTDHTVRYLKKVVSRDLHLSTSYNIEFGKGEWKINPLLENNEHELNEIKRNIGEVLRNEDFVLDSILVTATCSPEGKIHVNEKLSMQRGKSIKDYIQQYVTHFNDSLNNGVWTINADSTYTSGRAPMKGIANECIKVTEVSEDWETLELLVESDTLLQDKDKLLECFTYSNPDSREMAMQGHPQFAYIKDNIYPKLRRVQFNFKLHRKGMLKDTVHTTQLDTVYMRGVEALENRDYKTAVALLRPYNCFNSAVAYVCMDYNNSALEILKELPRDAKRDYMLAVVHGRLGNEKLAVEYFLNAVEQDEFMRHRGNLDPEISALIKKYGIFDNL